MEAQAITPEVCIGADVLLVRSVTPVNEHLLDQSRVSFVGSATAGFDHVDQSYLMERGIQFSYAPGSNADSVVEYVLAALFRLSALKRCSLHGLTLGIVGCGNIGGRLAIRAPALGLQVLKNDPPLARSGQSGFVDLETVLTKSDVLTLHVPKSGDTFHLIGDQELQSMNPQAWILNTSRGSVVDTHALKRAISSGRIDGAVLDVWENEPEPDLELVQIVDLATSHIAGHSVDGKLQGTIMLYDGVIRHFGIQTNWDFEKLLQENSPKPISLNAKLGSSWLTALAQHLYNIQADDARMRQILDVGHNQVADTFRQLRRNYPPRRTFSRHRIMEVPPEYQRAVREGLRVDYL